MTGQLERALLRSTKLHSWATKLMGIFVVMVSDVGSRKTNDWSPCLSLRWCCFIPVSSRLSQLLCSVRILRVWGRRAKTKFYLQNDSRYYWIYNEETLTDRWWLFSKSCVSKSWCFWGICRQSMVQVTGDCGFMKRKEVGWSTSRISGEVSLVLLIYVTNHMICKPAPWKGKQVWS